MWQMLTISYLFTLLVTMVWSLPSSEKYFPNLCNFSSKWRLKLVRFTINFRLKSSSAPYQFFFKRHISISHLLFQFCLSLNPHSPDKSHNNSH